MIPDLTPDDDSINIVVFYKVTPTATAQNISITHSLKPGNEAEIQGTYDVETQVGDLEVSSRKSCFSK